MTIGPDIQILELGTGYACAYAGWVLARDGFSVVRPATGTAEDHRWIHRRKATVTEEQLRQTLKSFDVVITDSPDRIGGLLTLGGRRPPDNQALSVVLIGPPGADPKANALIAAHTGVAAAIGEATGPPLAPPGRQLEALVGLHAAGAAVAAVIASRRDGLGEEVTINPLECVASMVAVNAIQYVDYGLRWYRAGRTASQSGGPFPFRMFRAKDGWVVIITRSLDEWNSLLDMLDRPEWSADPRFRDPLEIARNHAEEVAALIEDQFANWTVAELEARGRAHRVPLAPIRSSADVLGDRRLAATEDHTVDLVPPVITEGDVTGARPLPSPFGPSPAPPLAGLRVLDLGWVWAAPITCGWLADLGADVVKVESLTRLDVARRRGVEFPSGSLEVEGRLPGYERALVFNAVNRNKRSVSLDLKDQDDVATFLALVGRADIVVESFSTGVLDRLGLGWDRLHTVNPRLILVSMGGASGDAEFIDRSYAPMLTALAGVEGAVRGSDGEPIGMLNWGVADPSGGAWAAYGVLATVARCRGGLHLRASQLRGIVNTCAALYLDPGPEAFTSAVDEAVELTAAHIHGDVDDPVGRLYSNVIVGMWDPRTGERKGVCPPWSFRRIPVRVRSGAPLLGSTAPETVLEEWAD